MPYNAIYWYRSQSPLGKRGHFHANRPELLRRGLGRKRTKILCKEPVGLCMQAEKPRKDLLLSSELRTSPVSAMVVIHKPERRL